MTAALALAAALTTTTPAHAADPCTRYVKLAHKAGWPRAESTRLRQIMFRESRCIASNVNTRDPWGGSFGLMQINGSNRGFLVRAGVITEMRDLLNPYTNLRAALALYRLHGWKPWGTKPSQP